MTCSKVCKERGPLLFAAVNSLVQSFGSTLFGIFAILMHACVITPTPPQLVAPVLASYSAFASTFYLEYFHSQDVCKNRSVIYESNRNVNYWKDMKNFTRGVVTSSDHVQTLFVVYLADNAIWLLATFLFLYGIYQKTRWIHIVYATSQFIVMLYDVILCIIFGLDIQPYMNLVTDYPIVTKSAMLTNIIVMMLISMRFLLFFIMNIVFFVYVIRAIKMMGEDTKSQPPLSHIPQNPQALKILSQEPRHPQRSQQSVIADYPDVIKYQPAVQVEVDPFDEIEPRKEVDSFNERGLRRKVNTFDNRGPRREVDPFDEREPRREVEPFDGRGQRNVRQSVTSPEELPRRRYSPPRDYEINYTVEDYDQPESEKKQTSAQYHSPQTNSDDETINVPVRASVLRRSSSEVLKNQRPWSYIRPEDLTSSPNKLNKFFNQLNTKNGSSLEPVQQEADENEQATSTSLEDEPLHQMQKQEQKPATGSRRDLVVHIYENLDPTKKSKKNVRFNHVSSSLEYLETSFPVKEDVDDVSVSKNRRYPVSRNSSIRKAFLNPINRLMGSSTPSGHQEICTDEFVFKSPLIKANGSVAASSPDLLFDSAFNSVKMIYSDRPMGKKKTPTSCRRKGQIWIHVPPCDGVTCRRGLPTETSF